MKDYVVGLAASSAAIFAPTKELVLVTLTLIVVDLVTGLLAAKKRGEWVKLSEIKSAGLRRTVSKTLIYLTAILVGFLIERFMLEGFVPVSKLAAALISVVEGKSIYENLDTLNAQPIFKSLVQKLGSVNDQPQEAKPEEKKPDQESL